MNLYHKVVAKATELGFKAILAAGIRYATSKIALDQVVSELVQKGALDATKTGLILATP